MNLSNILQNKFIVAIPLAIILVGCLYKYNEYKDITNEKEGHPIQKGDFKYYIKFLLIFYLVSIVFVILLKSGYKKLRNKETSNTDNIFPENIKIINEQQKPSKPTLLLNTNPIKERNTQLNNDIKDLNMNVDTSELQPINIVGNKVNNQKKELIKTQNLLNKRKQLIELKKKRTNKGVETINTGTPNF